MNQLTFWSEELPANHLALQDCVKDLTIQEATSLLPMWEFLTNLDPSGAFGKMCQVSSVLGGGRDFGSFLGALGEIGYGWAYRVLDAQHFGVPQRRRRVFVVGCLGDWRAAAEVLFDSHSLSGNTKKGRKARERAAYPVADCAPTLCARDYKGVCTDDATGGGKLIMTEKVSPTLQTSCNDYSRADGFTMMVYETHPADSRVKEMGDVCQTVTSRWGTGGGNVPIVQKAYSIREDATANNFSATPLEVTPALQALRPSVQSHHAQTFIAGDYAVRRLTPTECERLQGFPDNYTNIKENCPDGPRYKALGNSMAVPVMRWIGQRIDGYEQRGMEKHLRG